MIFECVLAHPPARAGVQMRPERELAGLLGKERHLVRTALGHLVKKGVLVRMRGSGTFVRRTLQNSSPSSDVLTSLKLTPSDFFLKGNENGGGVNFPVARQQLHLGLIGDLKLQHPSSQKMLSEFLRQVAGKGHRLTVCPVFQSEAADFQMPVVDQMADALKNYSCDGYIVLATWADLFLQAVGGRCPPAAFFWTGACSAIHEPLFQIDAGEAVERAVALFHREGRRRVAVINLEKPEPHCRIESTAYDRAAELSGQSYRLLKNVPLNPEQIMDAVARMMREPEPPDALYVADDTLMPAVASALDKAGIRPGFDLGVISHSNRGIPLPAGTDWSRLEFNLESFVCLIVEHLVKTIQQTDVPPVNLKLQANWRAGATHGLKENRGGDESADPAFERNEPLFN
ncbi:MAG: GntR family transcriptional regulator [Verrucomicrobiae bacterium]|nr:GntR family transcriptional regulator [Verrucomicrobiae bacterium]